MITWPIGSSLPADAHDAGAADHAVAVHGLRLQRSARPSDGALAGFLRERRCRRA